MGKLELEKEIKRHRKLYYSEFRPEISDEKFDWLVGELRKLDPTSPVLSEVGAIPKKRKVILSVILGSLEKISVTNVLDWMKNKKDDIMASLKLDGISIFAEWEGGKLKKLSTRGNGKIGENLLHKAYKFKNLPLEIKEKEKIQTRGEAIVEGVIPKEYKNRRSAAIGIIGRDDLKKADKISIRFYELIRHPSLQKSEKGRFEQMKKIGLKTPKKVLIKEKSLRNGGEKVVEKLVTILKNKKVLHYDIDGMVLTKNLSKRENVFFPKNSIALKINANSLRTKVKKIIWNTTRTGKVVPVVHIDQVEVDGVEISHPSGHNYDYLKKKGIGEGATITVVRSGDVIPYIDSIIKKKKPKKPNFCPVCKSDLEQVGVNLICPNPICEGKLLAQLTYFISILGVENISVQTFKNLNLFTLKSFLEITHAKIARTSGFGERKADIFLEERKKIFKVKEEDLLTAFGIPLIGPKIAKKIINSIYKGKFVLMFKENKEKMRKNLLMIDGIGPSVAESFIKNIGGCQRNFFLLRKHGMKFIQKREVFEKTLEGKTFQITGTLSIARKRVAEDIELHGGQMVSVTRNLDFLIKGITPRTTTKEKKANSLGVPIITEKELMEMIHPMMLLV